MTAKEISILKSALINEVEGEEFYRIAAAQVTEPDLADVFTHLANEENLHQKWIREIMTQINNGKISEITPFDNSPSPGIFNLSKLSEVPHSGFEMSAFHIGIMMEKASMDYYRDAAVHTSIAEARQLFEMLAGWERHHWEALEEAYDTLKAEWWEKQGFSPA